MRQRRHVWGFLWFALLVGAPVPAIAQQVSQSISFVFTPFVIALTIIVPFKVIMLARTARCTTWAFIVPVIAASVLTVLVTIPLIFGKYFYMPFHPDRYMTLILISALVMFCVSYCIDGVAILVTCVLLAPIDRLMTSRKARNRPNAPVLLAPLDRLLIGTTLTNVVVFGLLGLFGIGFWNFSHETYEWLVTIGDSAIRSTYRVDWIMLLM